MGYHMPIIHSSLHGLSACFVLVVFMPLLFSFASFVFERGSIEELVVGRERNWQEVMERKIGSSYVVQKFFKMKYQNEKQPDTYVCNTHIHTHSFKV